MLKKNDFFRVGYISKTHGVKGEMMLLCDHSTDFDRLGEYLFFNIDECLIPFKIISLRSSTEKTVLFSCEQITSVEAAAQHLETDIYLPLAQKKEILDSDSPDTLIGCRVVNEATNTSLGIISDYIDSPHNPLLEITHDGQEILLPFQEEFILGLENYTLFVALPEGLLDLE